MPPFWHLEPSHFSPLLHERFTFQMPAGTQESRGGLAVEGYCRRADLIKRQAATVRPPRSSPPHLSSTERGNKSDRVQSLSLICQWGEWVGMRLSDRSAVGVCRVSLIELWLGRKWHVMSWAGPLWDITNVDSVGGDGAEKQLKWNLSVCKVHDVVYG